MLVCYPLGPVGEGVGGGARLDCPPYGAPQAIIYSIIYPFIYNIRVYLLSDLLSANYF